MEPIHLTTIIKAPREKVWDAMLADETYRDWTSVFMQGSYYEGNWEQGSKMLFLAPGEKGQGESGMVSRIKESRRHKFVSVEHLGVFHDGVEDTISKDVKDWAGAYENYTFKEVPEGTELTIDMLVLPKEKALMEDAWKKGLERLRQICEK